MHDGLKLKETFPDGKTENWYFADDVGCIREESEGGDLPRISRTAK